MSFTMAARYPEPSCLSLPENQFYGYVGVCLLGTVALSPEASMVATLENTSFELRKVLEFVQYV